MTDTPSPVPGVTLKTTKANNIDMRYAEIGSGPLVLFCHGWPESWYSWRHQLTGVSAAGFRCVAPDMRGYGGTQAAELVKALGETRAVIVGHDWGAPVAWHAALWRPDLFPAVCAMSVPYAPPGYVDVLSALEKLGINDFYLQYFQKPDVPEAELQQDIRGALRRIYFTAGGELTEKGKGFARLTGGTLLANTVDPEKLPPWLSEADLDYYTQEFSRTGFRGSARCLPQDPARPARQPHPRKCRPLGAAGAARGRQSTADPVPQRVDGLIKKPVLPIFLD